MAASMSPSAQDAAERAKLPDWRDATRASTRHMTCKNAETKLHKNMEKLDENTLRQVMSHMSTEDRHSFSRTSTTNYNLMNMYTGRFIYNAGGECFLACSLYDFKQQNFVLYRPAGLKFTVMIIDGKMGRLDNSKIRCEISDLQTRTALLLAVQSKPSRVEFKRLHGVTSNQILTVCEQIPDLIGLYVSDCPNATLSSLICKDSLDRLERSLKYKDKSALLVRMSESEDEELVLVDEMPVEVNFISTEATKREYLVEISYDMAYLTDLYEADSSKHTEPTNSFDLETGLALEFIEVIKTLYDGGYDVFKKPDILRIIRDMEAFLWRGRDEQRRKDQDFVVFLQETVKNWPDHKVSSPDMANFRFDLQDDNDQWPGEYLLAIMPDEQRKSLMSFWAKIRYHIASASGDSKSYHLPYRTFKDIRYCWKHDFISHHFFPLSQHMGNATSMIGGPQCYRCRYDEARFAFSTVAQPQSLPLAHALQALSGITFEDQRMSEDQCNPDKEHLETFSRIPKALCNPDGSLEVLGFDKHITPNFMDPKKCFRRPALASDTGKARMSRDLILALAEMRVEDNNYHQQKQQAGMILSPSEVDVPGYVRRYNFLRASTISYLPFSPLIASKWAKKIKKKITIDREHKIHYAKDTGKEKLLGAAETKPKSDLAKQRAESLKRANRPRKIAAVAFGDMICQTIDMRRERRKREDIPDSHITIFDRNLTVDDVCPLSVNSECYIHNCDKLKPCLKEKCTDLDCCDIHKKPCPRFSLGLGRDCCNDCKLGDHNGIWLEACTVERRNAHEQGHEKLDDEEWVEARAGEQRILKSRFLYFLHGEDEGEE